MIYPVLSQKNICIATFVVVFVVTPITIISIVATSTSKQDKIRAFHPAITSTSTEKITTIRGSTESTIETTKIPQGPCEIKSATRLSPLPIYYGSNSIMYPRSGVIKILNGENIEFACPQNNVNFNNIIQGPLVVATCINGYFVTNNEAATWENILCSSIPNPTMKLLNDLDENDPVKDCYTNNSTEVSVGSIGLQLDSERYFSYIKICFDMDSKIALYSFNNISEVLNERVRDVTRTNFRQDNDFYRNIMSVQNAYGTNGTTINNLLLNTNVTINNDVFINRGHLASRNDFIYASMQVASDRFINIAPQWNTFDEGNWRQIEEDVRNYTINQKIELQIWTGTFGVAQVENVDLYLSSNPKILPVPAILWKLVYDSVNKRGVVFIGHNNPFLNMEDDLKMCQNDVTGYLKWVHIDQSDATKGISYACNYNEIKQKIDFMPQIDVTSLLL